jgi:hypothetical protein
MAKRQEGWTEIGEGGGRTPSDGQEVEFSLAGTGDHVLQGTFQEEKRPTTDGIKWVFVSRDENGRPKTYRHGVTRWRPAKVEAKAAR